MGCWDAVDVKCSVVKTDTGWEMLYKGLGDVSYRVTHKFGYATSQDGVSWVKYPGNPIFRETQDPIGRVDYIIAPSLLKDGSTYYLYYSYLGQDMEGVATGAITEP